MSPPNYPASLAPFISRFLLQLPQAVQIAHYMRPAAVLIPIVCRLELALLLTRRAGSLRKHGGPVAFPGGKTDAEDGSPIVTVLRESQEEVAIPPQAVTVIGQLTPLDSSSGFQVTPVVGLVSPEVQLHVCEAEVADVFEMPLRESLTLPRYYSLDIHHGGHSQRIYVSWYQSQFVWGLTAAIIRRLAQQVSI